MNIRKATSDDLVPMSQLFHATFQEPPFSEKATVEQVIPSITECFDRGGAFVVYEEDQLIAALSYELDLMWQGTIATVDDMAVLESYRDSGIGTALLEAFEEYCMSQKFIGIDVTTHVDSRALYFWKKQNYIEAKKRVSLYKELK